jgi:pyruvate dehydrogenase E1 component alpha subunit
VIPVRGCGVGVVGSCRTGLTAGRLSHADPSRYRSAAEEDYWRQRDPIDRLEKHLAATGALSEDFRAGLAAEADALGEKVRTFVRSLGRPATSTMFDHVYATPHSVVDAERAWFERYEASFAGGEHR